MPNPVDPLRAPVTTVVAPTAATRPAANPEPVPLNLPDPPLTAGRLEPLLTLVPPQPQVVVPQPTIHLVSTVGRGGRNRTDDVKLVQQRLRELGFPISVDGRMGPQTQNILSIFAAAVENRDHLAEASSRIGSLDAVGQRLFATDAPRWVEIPQRGVGFLRVDTDGYHWGTDQTVAVIEEAGRHFHQDYATNDTDVFPIKINDVSKRDGSVTVRNGRSEHDSHRCGLDVDIGLPKKAGSERMEWGTRTNWANYDGEAAYAIIAAFAHQDAVTRIILYDSEIEERARREEQPWVDKLVQDDQHRSHFHIDITCR